MVIITIALPTYNRSSILEGCIRSILLQSFDDYEFIIIDDGSSDKTPEILRKLADLDHRIRFYRNDANKGLPQSRNKAVALSRSDFMFFVEDDLTLHPNCLSALYETFKKLTDCGIKVGAIGARLIQGDSEASPKKSTKVVHVNKFNGMIHSDFSINIHVAVEVPTLHSCSLVHKAVFKEVGGYDHHRYKGTSFREETDFYFRARRLGYKLFYQPNAIAWHRKVSVGGCRKPHLREGYFEIRNHILFLIRFYGITSVFMLPCYIAYIASRMRRFLAQNIL